MQHRSRTTSAPRARPGRQPRRRAVRRGWPALLLALLCGCSGRLVPAPGPAEAESFAPRAVSALRAPQGVYLSYRVEERALHAFAGIGSEGAAGPQAARPLIQPLEPVSEEAWQAARDSAEPLAVFDRARWRQLLERTMASLLPPETDRGVVVDVLLLEELFVYRDAEATLLTVPLAYKPPELGIAASIGFGELLRRAGAFVDALRGAEHARSSELLFETGDVTAFGYPFVYVDTASGRFRFLRDARIDDGVRAGNPLAALLHTFAHTVTSHLRVATDKPVSSLARLFTLVSQSTLDVARPTPLAALAGTPVPPLADAPGMELEAWEQRLDELTGTRRMPGRLRYLVDGRAFFPRLHQALADARESIDLRLYIFDNDDYALQFADLLRQRSHEVRVRMLIDGLGTLGAGQASAPSLPPGHAPPRSISGYLRRDSQVELRVLGNPWLVGDHTKAITVDGSLAFIGGMNIGREYRYDWHDLMIEVDGPVVGLIADEFELAWKAESPLGDLQRLFHRRAPGLPPAGPEHYPVRPLYTRPGDSQILRAQIAAIRAARQRIYLQNAYLTSDAVIYELARARRRGVDVRVILPASSDNGLIGRSNVLAANAMLRHGIRVYVYPGMSHVKAALYDGWACFGSANFDHLSLRVNKEFNLATAHPPAVAALVEQLFTPDFARSLELTAPLPSNWSDHLAELLADFL